jgi:hypothetical protein
MTLLPRWQEVSLLESGQRILRDRDHDGTDLLHPLEPCKKALPRGKGHCSVPGLWRSEHLAPTSEEGN